MSAEPYTDPDTGITYAGEHAVCHRTADRLRREFRATLDEHRARADADAAIGRAVRRLLLPGVKRKMYRRDELQAIVDAADRAAA